MQHTKGPAAVWGCWKRALPHLSMSQLNWPQGLLELKAHVKPTCPPRAGGKGDLSQLSTESLQETRAPQPGRGHFATRLGSGPSVCVLPSLLSSQSSPHRSLPLLLCPLSSEKGEHLLGTTWDIQSQQGQATPPPLRPNKEVQERRSSGSQQSHRQPHSNCWETHPKTKLNIRYGQVQPLHVFWLVVQSF